MELTFIPQRTVADLESCFPPCTYTGSPRTEKEHHLGHFCFESSLGAEPLKTAQGMEELGKTWGIVE